MVCAVHRLFRIEREEIMEGEFDPEKERRRRELEEEIANNPGWLTRLFFRFSRFNKKISATNR